jgi:hypothetical protein
MDPGPWLTEILEARGRLALRQSLGAIKMQALRPARQASGLDNRGNCLW